MFQKMHKMRNEKGFTLIELMIVVAILGVLAAVAIPQYMSYIATSKRRAALSNYTNAQRIVKGEFSRVDAGNVPASCDDLVAELNGETYDAPTDVWDAVPTNPNPYHTKDALGALVPGFENGVAPSDDGITALSCATYLGDPGDQVTILVWYIAEDGTQNTPETITMTKE